MSEKLFKIISLIVMLLVLLFNIIGAILTIQTTGGMEVTNEPKASVMPYTRDTPYDIKGEPVYPEEDIVIQ